MHAKVDNRKCQGFGLCKLAAPDIFEVGEDDGYAFARIDPIPADKLDEAEAAARQCPMNAIDIATES